MLNVSNYMTKNNLGYLAGGLVMLGGAYLLWKDGHKYVPSFWQKDSKVRSAEDENNN